jgi:heterodisulfide reductase subunit B
MEQSETEQKDTNCTGSLGGGESDTSNESVESMPSLRSQQIASAKAAKAEAIRHACSVRDLEALASLATSEGGLMEDELRKVACELTG